MHPKNWSASYWVKSFRNFQASSIGVRIENKFEKVAQALRRSVNAKNKKVQKQE